VGAACGGGGSSAPVPPPVVAPISPSSVTQEDANPMWASATVSTDLLYLGNIGNNSISVYKHDAKGNTKPLRVIVGSNTGIDMPGQLSGDAQGHLYVANGSFGTTGQSSHPAVLVFAAGANGNVTPIRKLAGARTGIHHIDGLVVDKSTGEIFVVDSVPDPTGPAYYQVSCASPRTPPEIPRRSLAARRYFRRRLSLPRIPPDGICLSRILELVSSGQGMTALPRLQRRSGTMQLPPFRSKRIGSARTALPMIPRPGPT